MCIYFNGKGNNYLRKCISYKIAKRTKNFHLKCNTVKKS